MPKTTKRTTRPKASKTTRRSRPAAFKSFTPASNVKFFSFQPTIQTLYWLLIGALVVGLAAWALTLQLQILAIYDRIDTNSTDIYTIKELQALRAAHKAPF